MFGEEKNLKDNSTNSISDTDSSPVPYTPVAISSDVRIGSYSKSDKLITALYMVTDILEKEEPIRAKLRSIGAELLSDIYSASFLYRTDSNSKSRLLVSMESKVSQIISFLEIAFSINIISEMNVSILKKEFLELQKAIKESSETNTNWLRELMSKKASENTTNESKNTPDLRNHFSEKKIEQKENYIGHSKGHNTHSPITQNQKPKDNFDVLKKQRRADILEILGGSQDGMTISDIKLKATGSLAVSSEKTLQRELVSMVKDGVLKKEGEKRWSKYFVLKQ